MRTTIRNFISAIVAAALLLAGSANAAVSYQFTDATLGLPAVSVSNDTTQRTNLGRIASVADATYGEGEVIYVKFTGTVAAGDFVLIDRQGKTAVQLPNSAPGANKVSISGVALAAQTNGAFGWVLIRGVHDLANTSNSASTVGQVMSGGGGAAGRAGQGVANYILDGTVLRVAPAGAATTSTVELYWPICSGR